MLRPCVQPWPGKVWNHQLQETLSPTTGVYCNALLWVMVHSSNSLLRSQILMYLSIFEIVYLCIVFLCGGVRVWWWWCIH